jgi:uncharacterized protein (DUF1697 family)
MPQQTYITLLRGINVSGQKKIKMAELKVLYEKLELINVKTYIQSGNVIFTSTFTHEHLKNIIEAAITQQYSFNVIVSVIPFTSFKLGINNLPFPEVDVENEGNKVLLSFLSTTPTREKKELLLSYVKSPEQLVIIDNVVYLHCPNGYGKSKLTNNFVENKLKLDATTRNLKTVYQLLAMAEESELTTQNE